jgi:hypothetical protein
MKQPNHPAASKAGFSFLFAIARLWPGLPEPGRSTTSHARE